MSQILDDHTRIAACSGAAMPRPCGARLRRDVLVKAGACGGAADDPRERGGPHFVGVYDPVPIVLGRSLVSGLEAGGEAWGARPPKSIVAQTR